MQCTENARLTDKSPSPIELMAFGLLKLHPSLQCEVRRILNI
jgi:hypothetical protein